MAKSLLAIVLCSVSLLFASCDRNKINVFIPKDNFSGVWVVDHVVPHGADDPAAEGILDFNRGRYINFMRGMRYTNTIHGQFDYGTYSMVEGAPDSVNFQSFRGNQYGIVLRYDGTGRGSYSYDATVPGDPTRRVYQIECKVEKFKYRNASFDAFSLENNYWQIPAEHPESDSLKIVRLVNHIDFWKAYLSTANQLDKTSLDQRWINTCFTFSVHGIQVQKFDKWPAPFVQLFYSRQEAEKASKILLEAMYKIDVKKNENAYKLGLDVFNQTQYQLSKKLKPG